LNDEKNGPGRPNINGKSHPKTLLWLGEDKSGIERPDIYVLSRFLERLWLKNQPMKKTKLQMAVGLNYTQFIRYLDWMLDRGLVEKIEGEDKHEYIKITPKGYQAYQKLVAILKEVFGEADLG
jgi:predicted transcriptional regulator